MPTCVILSVMPTIRKTFLRATLTMTGTIIGAGIFGVPAVITEAGIVTGSILFWITWLVILATHLLYLELILLRESALKMGKSHSKRHRLPGYVSASLGPWAKYVTAAIQSLQLIGASFAYLIIGGEFVGFLLTRFGVVAGETLFQVVFWLIGALAILLALRAMSKIESVLTWALLFVLTVLVVGAGFQADSTRFVAANWELAFMPIGVFLFSLFGMTIIPEVFEITGRRPARTRHAVILGSFTAALFTWLFGIFVSSAVPAGVAPDRAAMVDLLPGGLWWVLPLVGLFAVLTSFITSAFGLKMMYRIELKQPRIIARLVALGAPLALLFLVPTDFLVALDVVGVFFTGGNALLVVLAAYVAMHHAKERRPFWWRTAAPILAASFFAIVIFDRLLGILGS